MPDFTISVCSIYVLDIRLGNECMPDVHVRDACVRNVRVCYALVIDLFQRDVGCVRCLCATCLCNGCLRARGQRAGSLFWMSAGHQHPTSGYSNRRRLSLGLSSHSYPINRRLAQTSWRQT